MSGTRTRRTNSDCSSLDRAAGRKPIGQWEESGNERIEGGRGAESGKGELQLHPPPTRVARATPAASGGGMYGRSHVGPRRALVSPNSPVQGELRYGGEHARVGGNHMNAVVPSLGN